MSFVYVYKTHLVDFVLYMLVDIQMHKTWGEIVHFYICMYNNVHESVFDTLIFLLCLYSGMRACHFLVYIYNKVKKSVIVPGFYLVCL